MKLSTLLVMFSCAASAQPVITYHNGLSRHGVYTVRNLTPANAAKMHIDTNFNAPFSGNVYAQPLFWHSSSVPQGEVIVATESDTVYAFNAVTGAVLWQTKLGTPVPRNDLPCGNIDPEGITGTPALDPSSGTVYLDALIDTTNGPRQQIFALNPQTGAVLPNWPVDVQSALAAQNITFDSTLQGERGGVLLFKKNLYVSYAGRWGDCGDYHGTVLQLSPSTRAIGGFWATRAQGGGIWAQGGPFTDGTNIFVTTGNTFGASSWSDGEAIIRLAPGLAHSTATTNYFTPADWQTLDQNDKDLGGTDAVALTVPSGSGTAERLLALGKDGHAYLTSGANLGGIGNEIKNLLVSNDEIKTAAAVYQTASQALVAFQNVNDPNCKGQNTITMLSVTATNLTPLWCAPFNGAGAPIITTTDGTSNPIVWVAGASGDELLHGFNALTGAVVFNGGGSGNAMSGVRTYATILAAIGRLYIAGSGRIYAYQW